MPQNSNQLSGAPKHASIFLLCVLATVSLVLSQEPIFRLALLPLEYLDTVLHELGHALACLATGGDVTGLTIVGDGDGHAGLTMTTGGVPFIYNQTGYLGTTMFGCLMLSLGGQQNRARGTLIGFGLLIAFGSIACMVQTFTLGGHTSEAVLSIVIGVALGAALLLAGLKASHSLAQYLLLFLGVQIGINALNDTLWLTKISLGLVGAHSFTDATNMANLTGWPAAFWSILWGALSSLMLFVTIKFAYLSKK